MRKTARRAFIRGSLWALAGWAIPGRPAFAAGRFRGGPGDEDDPLRPARAHGFELGLASYTFREFDLDATLAMAGRLGLARIALKSVHLPLESSEAEIRAVAAKTRAAGIIPYGCGVVYMSTEAEVEQAFAYARAAGMDVIIGVPGHELLGRVERKARETGIKLAVHNHGPGDLLYPTPRTILDRIGRLGPGIGVCLDIGHCQRSGIDPSEAAAACGARLLDVHLKDVTAPTKDGTAVEAGRGVIDIPRFLRTLAALDYRGTAAFEYEKDGQDPLPGLSESVGYVRGILASMDDAGKTFRQ